VTEIAEDVREFVTDGEKAFMLLAKLYTEMHRIAEHLVQDQLEIDMYGSDPSGIFGVIGGTGNSAPLARQYNGPYVIRDIIATWAAGEAAPTSVRLVIGDRTFQCANESGLFAITDVNIKVARDDQVILTVVPAAACHLEIMGYAEKRRNDRT
jgi:hypothetical protein